MPLPSSLLKLPKDPTTATATRTLLKSEKVLSVFIAIIRTHLSVAKFRRTLLKLSSRGPYPSSEREITFRRCLFTFPQKCEISHFHVVFVQKGQEKGKKSVMHVQKVVVLLNKPFGFFDVLVAVASLDL